MKVSLELKIITFAQKVFLMPSARVSDRKSIGLNPKRGQHFIFELLLTHSISNCTIKSLQKKILKSLIIPWLLLEKKT